jgi:hypothetical protein
MTTNLTMPVCGKTGWAGCGKHVNEVMSSVPISEWCTCRNGDKTCESTTSKYNTFGEH